jgi:hypothetical protein
LRAFAFELNDLCTAAAESGGVGCPSVGEALGQASCYTLLLDGIATSL